ncbi:MAG: hypothetical protein GY839_09475 [candidate division Zixibacteria bacterium]|nr:hypothetical protein [candidate division Zixibacteria bacterium]
MKNLALITSLALIFSGWISVPAPQADVNQSDSIEQILPLVAVDVNVNDMPNDPGGALVVEWSLPDADETVLGSISQLQLYRTISPDSTFELITSLSAGSDRYEDSGLNDGQSYYYQVIAFDNGTRLAEGIGGPGVPKGQWFNTSRVPILLLVILFAGTAIAFILRAKGGYQFYIRPIAGIKAVDDAIGRATEMGQPILFVPGLGTAADVATIAAFTILGRVARKVVEYNTRLIVPNYDPVVMTVCQEVVKEAYSAAGKPEMYDPKDVYFITQDQFPYTAAVNGVMLRQKPATNFYMGMFYAESLVLAETGFVSGSIQIAGTDQLVQIPFFVSVCDFVLMGEELYAASAYLSQEPQQLGTLKAQDWGKVLVVTLIILGMIFTTIGWESFAAWFDVG